MEDLEAGRLERIRSLIKRQIVIAAVCAMIAIIGIAAVVQAAAGPVFNSQKLSLKEGQTKTLKIKNVKKENIKKTVFKSSKNSVAKVTGEGEVTGIKQGKATITCKLTLKSKKKYTLKCKVTVKSDSQGGNMADTGHHTQGTVNTIRLFIGEKEIPVRWEDNESVDALREIIAGHPLRVQMSMYGGFEQVGALGMSIPRNDVRTTTNAGDIVLYSGNQIVIFYGSNSWAYTRLGRVMDMSADEISELLGNGDVMITLSE